MSPRRRYRRPRSPRRALPRSSSPTSSSDVPDPGAEELSSGAALTRPMSWEGRSVDYTTIGIALTIDDVGASSKHFEVYGLTRLPLGRLKIPFPGNFLFLKYMPPIKRWGPYRELEASEWDRILSLLETGGSRLTVAITAGWVEANGRIVPFPHKYPEAAAVIREGVARRHLENSKQ